ncbi:MAG: methyltransferase domain-containing protein [Candidatus Hydrogenedentota bacterium]
MIDKAIISKNFSKYANTYDRYANIQNNAASDLLEFSGNRDPKYILELGTGTGNYTLLITEKFPLSKIISLDISEAMVKQARNKIYKAKSLKNGAEIEFLVADAEETHLTAKFDLITSNATFQWFNDLDLTLDSYKNMLNKNGLLSFSIFGPETFNELRSSICEYLKKDSKITSSNFFSKEQLITILQKYFYNVSIKEIIYKENYSSLKELLLKIKHTGTQGIGLNKRLFFTKKIIADVEDVYKTISKNITATYQVYLCKAEK